MSEPRGLMTSIKNESLVQRIINKITDSIVAGELKPGDKLPTEMELIAAFGVSRNTVREAIRTLIAYGVVEIRRPEGTFICDGFSNKMINPILYRIILQKEDSYKDLLGLRQIIESGIYHLILAQGLTDEEVENLEQINTELEQKLRMDDYDVDDISETDMMLHKAIAETTHNSLVVMIHDFVLDLTSESRRRTIEKVFAENDREYLIRTHRMALDALEKKPGSDVDEVLRYSYYYWTGKALIIGERCTNRINLQNIRLTICRADVYN